MEKHEFKIVKTKRKNGSIKITTVNTMPSMTDASFADDADVNKVVARFMQKGDQSVFYRQNGVYMDLTYQPKDLAEATEQLRLADEAFLALPSATRERFKNDPLQMIEFLNDSKNRDEAIKLGMIDAPVVTPVVASVENQPSEGKRSAAGTKTKTVVASSEPPAED